MKKVNVYLADGFEEIEAITIIDILRRGDVNVQMISIKKDLIVVGAHGIPVRADKTLSEMEVDADGHVLPGGMPGTENLFHEENLKKVLSKAFAEGKLLGAICAAPSALGRWGLLEGKKATCYPGFEEMLIGASLKNDSVVKDGNIFTSKGPGTAMEFGLALVEELVNRETKEEVKAGLLFKS